MLSIIWNRLIFLGERARNDALARMSEEELSEEVISELCAAVQGEVPEKAKNLVYFKDGKKASSAKAGGWRGM